MTKKLYMTPEMAIVMLRMTQHLLAGSDKQVYNDDPVTDTGDLLGRDTDTEW